MGMLSHQLDDHCPSINHCPSGNEAAVEKVYLSRNLHRLWKGEHLNLEFGMQRLEKSLINILNSNRISSEMNKNNFTGISIVWEIIIQIQIIVDKVDGRETWVVDGLRGGEINGSLDSWCARRILRCVLRWIARCRRPIG